MSNELLPGDIDVHRMIHPTYNVVDEGRPSWSVLEPSAKDNGKTSVDRADFSAAEESFLRYTEHLSACAVLTFPVRLAIEACIIPVSDPLPTNHAHALLDFSGIEGKQRRKVSRKLCSDAWIACGKTYSYTG